MVTTVRPRRSLLYMPGSNARALEKAKTLAADGLILDLEDAVSPDAKETARAQVCDAVSAGGYGKRELVIRVNGLDTPWGRDDIVAAAKSGADALLFPKIETAATVQEVIGLMDQAGAPAEMALWCMMETPKAVLRAEEIAAASDRVACWVMGTNDLVKDTRSLHTPSRLPMVTALGICIRGARGYGLSILDGVHTDIQDTEGFEAVCRQGLEFGFDGKTLIHPSQVGPCNAVFSPSAAQIEASRKIVAAFAEAEAAGKGVVVVDGRMVENLHVEQAKRMLAMADAIDDMAAE
ncbi:MAG: CoA ester lyase [Minwuiales bacterium]|nr:CoA ester lyase [Minwuiales bacterium]